MMIVLLVAGIGLLLGGLLTVGIGIELDLSFGNTLIQSGAIVACTGVMTLGLWIALRELRSIALQFGSGLPAGSRAADALPSAGVSATLGDQAPEDGGFLFSRDQPAATEHPGHEAASPTPWHEEAASRGRGDAPPAPVEAAPAPKQRRNLLFSSTSRKERERAEARVPEASAAEPRPAAPLPALPPAAQPAEPPPATFDDAWPKSERSRPAEAPLPRRGGRAPSTFTEAGPAAEHQPAAARSEEQPQVTVLKSGVVDGMAYSLYSDGSIEAQMPEGMMRFASIDELRSHLDQRA